MNRQSTIGDGSAGDTMNTAGVMAPRLSTTHVIHVPAVPSAPLGACHAVKSGRLTWTSAITGARSADGDYPREAEAEMEQVLKHLSAVLDAAGHDWRDLVRTNVYYAADRFDDASLVACQNALAATVGAGSCAGTSVMLAPEADRARIAIEVVAAERGAKEVLPAVRGVHSGPWATATRVGSTLFVSAVAADRAMSDGGSPTGLTHQAGTAPGSFARSRAAYGNLARAAEAVRSHWPDCNGIADIVRLHQHMTRSDVDIAEFRRSRADLLRTGEFVSTSVVAGADDPDNVGHDPWIKIDAELAVGPRRLVSVPGVWANPGGLHAVLSNDIAFFQAQMGRDGAGVSVDDPERHADQLYANIDRVLATTELTWKDVVHARVFCCNRDQVAPAARHLRARMGDHPRAATCLIAGFFDPRALLEIEITVAL